MAFACKELISSCCDFWTRGVGNKVQEVALTEQVLDEIFEELGCSMINQSRYSYHIISS